MPLQLSNIHAICFDLDGTLSDTDDVYVQRVARILHPIRIYFPRQDVYRAARRFVMWLETPGSFLMGVPDSLGIDDEIADVMEWLNRQWPPPMKHFLLVPGVKETLQLLSSRFPLAIVSVRDAASTRLFLEKFELSPLFQTIVTAQTTAHTKPFPDPILYAARSMKIAPEACLMVGDTTLDIRAGRKAGAQTVGVLCGFGKEDELRRQGADLILPSTADLAQLLVK